MKVLVTGGGGFVGTHVCEYYSKKGEAVAFDNLTKHELARTGYLADSARKYNWNYMGNLGVTRIQGDVRNRDELDSAAKDCDYIVHAAAQPAMTISAENPDLDFSTNVLGTFNVLEIARKYDIPVVSCSSIHVYGPAINEGLTEGETKYILNPPTIDEDYPLLNGKLTPLHASKMAGEVYVRTYIDTYGLDAAVFRLTGMYGPLQFGGEDHGWVANFTIRTVLGWPINVYGTGKQVRDILYASDVVEAFDCFYKARKPGIYTIGGGLKHAISLIECLKLIEEITKKQPKVKFGPDREGDLRYFVADYSKAQKLLKWKPKVLPKEGITNLAEWIEDNKQLFLGKI